MSNNFTIDFVLTFETKDQQEQFLAVYDDMSSTIEKALEMEITEVFDIAEDNAVQVVGISDVIPGKKAFQYAKGLHGIQEVELWYEGGDRLMGEVAWCAEQPEVIHHQYLPDKYKPENDDMESMHRAYQAHFEREVYHIEDLWGYYAEKNS